MALNLQIQELKNQKTPKYEKNSPSRYYFGFASCL